MIRRQCPFLERKGTKRTFCEAPLRFCCKSKMVASIGQKSTKSPAHGCMQERNQVGLSLKNGESLRISVCHVSGWARGRVNNSFVSGQTQSGLSRSWALSIRSGVCLPCVPILRASLCLDEVWRLVSRYPNTSRSICPAKEKKSPAQAES